MQEERNPDRPLTLSEAADAVPKLRGKRLHNSTMWRWARRGCKARNGTVVRLEHCRVGGQICTTAAALDRFFSALAEADLESFRERDTAAPVFDNSPTPPVKPTEAGTRRAALEEAKAALAAEGI